VKHLALVGLAAVVVFAFACSTGSDKSSPMMMKCAGCKMDAPKDKICPKDGMCAHCDKCMAKCEGCGQEVRCFDMCPKCHKMCMKCDKCTAKCEKCGHEVKMADMCPKCGKCCAKCDTCAK
jgi:hypothetical protein